MVKTRFRIAWIQPTNSLKEWPSRCVTVVQPIRSQAGSNEWSATIRQLALTGRIQTPRQWQFRVESGHCDYECLIAFKQSTDALSGPIGPIGKKRLSAWRSWSLE